MQISQWLPQRVIFVIIGIILGAVVAVGIHIAIYVFGGKVRTGREITEQFEVPVFGEFKHSRARRPGKGIDKTIEKMEFRKDRTEEVTILDNICALIREQESGSRILLTGTIPESRMQELVGKLKGMLGEDVPLQTESSFLNNSRAITEAGKATAVIVAEEKHVSESEDVLRMMEVLSLSKTPVIGTILI